MQSTNKLGFLGLVSLIFCMTVGAGIFNLPQNLAVSASLGGTLLAWAVTAIGLLFLVGTLKILADRYPHLNAGIYEYAQEGYGHYTGFNMAWGYWLSACFANVAYAVMLNDSLGAFCPPLLRHSWPTVVFCSVMIWLMFVVVKNGLTTVKRINYVVSVFKLAAIAVIAVLLFMTFKLDVMTTDFWGQSGITGNLGSQVKGSMMVTLWCFIGIEGAVMVSARAKKPTDVGRASVAGFMLAWVLYVLVTVLSYGVMSQAELSTLEDPSVAYVLKSAIGDWAYYFVIGSVVLALFGGWFAWTLILGQVAMEAAEVKIFPQSFLRLNKWGMPTFGLLISSVMMEIFIMIVVSADNVYLAALSVTGIMVLPAYLFSGLYLTKTTFNPEIKVSLSKGKLWKSRLVGSACVLNCLWMIYAGGLDLLLASTIFYLGGLAFYLKARRERTPKTDRNNISSYFTPAELIVLLLISLAALVSLKLIINGTLKL